MECRETQNLLPEYSVGLIEGKRKADLDRHLAACPECTSELEKLSKMMLLVEDLDTVEPPAGLWNGVYNRITQPMPRESAWDRARDWFRVKRRGWSVGFATAALAAILLVSHVNHPARDDAFAAGEYIQGHAVHASQDLLADPAALNSIAVVAYREQVGGRH